jgi:hypothetical protein
MKTNWSYRGHVALVRCSDVCSPVNVETASTLLFADAAGDIGVCLRITRLSESGLNATQVRHDTAPGIFRVR